VRRSRGEEKKSENERKKKKEKKRKEGKYRVAVGWEGLEKRGRKKELVVMRDAMS
jgi:hypothetical protein